MIELEEAVSPKPAIQLPDHPDDAAWPHDINNTQSDCDTSKAHIWDAMVDELYGDEEEIEDGCEDEDGRSGIAGFVNYLHKEHLPKAESRYQKLAEAKQDQSSSTSSYETVTTCLSKVLTPEQMVVAVHADAELKRAFHKKRLTCSFGTHKKSQSTKKKAATSPRKQKVSPQSEPPLVCRRPRSKDAGLWKRTNVATDMHLKCGNALCGWCLNIRANLTASQRRSSRLRPRLVVGLIRFVRGSGVLRSTAVDVMA